MLYFSEKMLKTYWYMLIYDKINKSFDLLKNFHIISFV